MSQNENNPFSSPSCTHGRGIGVRRTSSGDARLTVTLPWLSIEAPSEEYRILCEASSCSRSCTRPRRSLGNQMMGCSSTAAGWLNSVGHSVFIGRADEGYDARNSFVNERAAGRFIRLSVESGGTPSLSWILDLDAVILTSKLDVRSCTASPSTAVGIPGSTPALPTCDTLASV